MVTDGFTVLATHVGIKAKFVDVVAPAVTATVWLLLVYPLIDAVILIDPAGMVDRV